MSLFIFTLLKIALILIYFRCCLTVEPVKENVVFLLNDQRSPVHHYHAQKLSQNLSNQASNINLNIAVKIASLDYPKSYCWNYILATNKLSRQETEASWYIFADEFSEFDLKKVSEFLSRHDGNEGLFFGKSLTDEDSTIIHHFDSVNKANPFYYPDPRTAIIVSNGLVKRCKNMLNFYERKIDFSIDPSYEFSKLLSSFDIFLINVVDICVKKESHCFVWSDPDKVYSHSKGNHDYSLEEIHFAVKTCSKYSKDRLTILRDTWLDDAVNYGLYSDIDDPILGTKSLNIPNTERGHCGKTIAIIKHVSRLKDIKWLVIADDDTLMSVSRLHNLLQFYDSSSLLAIGERYGYSLFSENGIEYLTGGAGFVLSYGTVKTLSNEGVCECPSLDTPDDMFLGVCFQRLGITIVHSRLFHQARPEDYSPELLINSSPISFHKYWNSNPRRNYALWLKDELIYQHPEL